LPAVHQAAQTLAMEKVNLDEKFAAFSEQWQPRIVGELNGQHVKVVRLQGEFVWHQHENEDEMFLVLDGAMKIELRNRTIDLAKGEFFIVPHGVEHRPVAHEEARVLLFEPASTLNTGNIQNERTYVATEL
jgi:mannose-6-phosphate isomerase-like protein (cupin superfamily)